MERTNLRVLGLLGATIISLHLACWTFSAPPKVKEEFFAAYEKDQRPIELTFRMVDQDGQGAKNFRFKVDLSRLHRFLGFIRYTREECHEVTTDEEGWVHFSMPGKKASYISFKEVDISRYVFSKSLRDMGEVPMSKFMDVSNGIELKVIRHGPVNALREIHPAQQIVGAEDENVFSLNPQDGLMLANHTNSCALIRVSNARRSNIALEEKLSSYRTGKDMTVDESVAIRLMCINGYEAQDAEDEFVSYAPLSGYRQEVFWHFKVSDRSSLPVRFFLRNAKDGTYYWFEMTIGIGGGMVAVTTEGRGGPKGSNNLYKDIWFDRKAFEAWSRRCP